MSVLTFGDRFVVQARIDQRIRCIEMDLDELIKDREHHPAHVAANFLELSAIKTKVDFLLSAIRPAAAAE